MLTRERLRTILAIAVPIILGLLSQTVLNLVDTSMVRDLGNAALAAVGIASFANFIAGAPIMGLSAGVQAMAARRIGEGKPESAALPLNGGLLVCLAFGVPWVLMIALFAPWWFPKLAGNEEIARVGMPYMFCRLTATVLVGMHFSFRAFWNATGRSTFYMFTLVVMHTLNIFLNWVLIYGNLGAPKLGVMGAGIANASAALLGVSMHLWLALREARPQGFLHGIPSRETMGTMLRISLPTSLQQLFFAGGMTALFALLARAGKTPEAGKDIAAASKVLMDILLAGLLPAMGYGMAGTTLVSQALGKTDVADAKSWGWHVSQVALVSVLVLATIPLAFPDFVLSTFLKDASTVQMARSSLRLIAGTVAIDAVGMVLQSCLIGAGDSRRVMIASLSMQWGVLLPLVAVMVLVFHQGMFAVWAVQASYRLIQAGTFVAMWRGEKWKGIRV